MMKTLALALGLTMMAGPALRAQDLGLDLGTKAPAALLETLDGKPADLSQYIGKTPVVIEFWATWCGNCKELEPTLRAVATKYGSQVKFVGVAVAINQSAELVRRFHEKHKLPMDILYDRKGAAAEAYDAPATSYIVVVDKKGLIVYTGLGGKQDLESAIRKAL
jgi:thiol-disulfide isomerase/thioredoxin